MGWGVPARSFLLLGFGIQGLEFRVQGQGLGGIRVGQGRAREREREGERERERDVPTNALYRPSRLQTRSKASKRFWHVLVLSRFRVSGFQGFCILEFKV